MTVVRNGERGAQECLFNKEALPQPMHQHQASTSLAALSASEAPKRQTDAKVHWGTEPQVR